MVNSSIFSSDNGTNKVFFTTGGNITYNNFETVVQSSAHTFEQDLTITATLNDTDGSESLSNVTISSLPAGVSVEDSNGDAVTVSSNAYSGSVSSGVDRVDTLTSTGLLDFTVTGKVTVTESTGGATRTTTASVLVDDVVEGLEYFTSSAMAGITNASGSFNYQSGDSVTFHAGAVTLGTATPEDLGQPAVFLQDLADVERTDLNDEYLENMAVFLQSLDENQNADDGIVISEETRTALAYADIDLPTATELEVQRLVESVGGTYVNEEEAMIHVRDALIRHTDLKLSDFDVHIDDDSTKLKDAINPTTATFAEVTFALDGAAPTFTLAGVISTGTSATTVVAEEPAYFAVDANTGSVEEEPVVEAAAEAAEAVEEEEVIEDLSLIHI